MDFFAHRIPTNQSVSLADIDPRRSGGFANREDAEPLLQQFLCRLEDLQQRLYAERKRAILVILQATDTAGKDGVIRKVIGPLDSRGIHVWSFKGPTEEEQEHDFLWRIHARAPRFGEIAVFNRSHYEDVLVARVLKLVPKELWSRRYEHINHFEEMLADHGTTIIKIFLHISKEEQRARLQSRLDDPSRRWKIDPVDLKMREHWDDFQTAYEDVLSRCSTDFAPWWVVPADRKWYRDLAVAQLLVQTLEKLDPQYPEPTFDWRQVVVK
jgi:PPK2 family polyphosphate:nucleotide phosphotransferase